MKYAAIALLALSFHAHAQVMDNSTVFPESSIPAEPAKAVLFKDAIFGAQIVRATDSNDCTTAATVSYGMWSAFNASDTIINPLSCERIGDPNGAWQ